MDILEELRAYLVQTGAKNSTIKQHEATLRRLLKEVGTLDADRIIAHLREKYVSGNKGKYLNHSLNSLRVIDRMRGTTIYSALPFFKEVEHMKSTMSDDEIESFLALPPVERRQVNHWHGVEHTSVADPKGYARWTLFFSILAFTGARPGEIAALTVNNVDFGRQIFIIEDSKTNTPRFIPIPPNIHDKIKEYIDNLEGGFLFPSRRKGRYKGGCVDSVDWGYNFHTRIKRLGIKRTNLSPYSFRHSLITRLLEEDVNIFKVQKIVGHRRLDTTAHYTHLTTKDIVESIKKHPLIRKGTSPHNIITALVETVRGYSLEQDVRFKQRMELSSNKMVLEVEW